MLTADDVRRDWSKKTNLLTIGRLAFACLPAVVFVFFPDMMLWCWVAVILFIAAASTEFWQGYIAGKLHQVTELGEYLDLAIDRLLMMPTMLALCYINPTIGMILFTVFVGVNESIVGWILVYAKMRGEPTQMLRSGKVKTILVAIAVVMLAIPQSGFMIEMTMYMVFVSSIQMFYSLAVYVKKYGHTHTFCRRSTC